MHKNKIKAELAKRWLDVKALPSTQLGQKCLRALKIEAIDDSLDAVTFLDGKIQHMDFRVRKKHRWTSMQNYSSVFLEYHTIWYLRYPQKLPMLIDLKIMNTCARMPNWFQECTSLEKNYSYEVQANEEVKCSAG